MLHHLNIECFEGPGLKIIAEELIIESQSQYQNIAIYRTKLFGKCLFLDGVIQCTERDHDIYDRAILKELRPIDTKLLILGGGDGYTADMALKLNPNINITIVELDKSVINISEKHLNQEIFDHPQVKVLIGDAISLLESGIQNSYDGIICDLTDYPIGSNKNELYSFYTKIFDIVNGFLAPSGWFAVYAGCNKNFVTSIANKIQGLKIHKAIIPSYGEPCFFIYKTY